MGRTGRLLHFATVMVALVMIGACTASPPAPSRPDAPLEPLVAAVVKGITSGHLADAPSTDPTLAEADYVGILKGMDGILPEVTAGEPRFDHQMAFVPLTYRWPLPGGDWNYQTEAPFVVRGDTWVWQWGAESIHPQLTSETRLVHTRTAAKRGQIVGNGGRVLMAQMPVLRLGIDKTKVDQNEAVSSAVRLAALLKINKDAYVARVRSAGARAFVEALTVRGPRTAIDSRYGSIPGAIILDTQQVLATEKGLATPILGTAGEATAEIIKKAKGTVAAGELVGLSGLQQRYDEQLRGTPGSTVSLAPRPSVAATPSSQPTATETGPRPVVFESEPTPGPDLEITLDLAMQRKAESIVGPGKSPTAMAVIDVKTGAVRVLAVSGSARGQTLANTGRYAPGSTFKVVTSLALLREGLTPDSMVNCPNTTVVNGRVIKNYSEFPANRVGRMRLREAVALSCNTAFVNERHRLSGAKLRSAAISLGMGEDHESGFPSFYGSVPDPDNVVGLAEASFGQGTVQGSPMSMAAVAASVSAGRTTVPYLINDNRPKQSGKPLTTEEAAGLRTLMGEVVRNGSGRGLKGLASGAKTGTAEYGTAKPPKTHAWMIAYTNDVAIAVLVADGASGSGSAGPLIKRFLS